MIVHPVVPMARFIVEFLGESYGKIPYEERKARDLFALQFPYESVSEHCRFFIGDGFHIVYDGTTNSLGITVLPPFTSAGKYGNPAVMVKNGDQYRWHGEMYNVMHNILAAFNKAMEEAKRLVAEDRGIDLDSFRK